MDKAPSIGSLVCLNTASCLRSLRVIAQVRTRVILVGNLVWEFPNLGTDRRTSKVNKGLRRDITSKPMSGLSGFIGTSLWPLSVNKTLPGPFQTRHSACDFYSFLTHFDPSETTRSILLWVAEMTSFGRQRSWGHGAIVSTQWILWEASNSAQRQSGWRACAGCDGHVESPDDHRTNPAELKVLGPQICEQFVLWIH